MWIYRGGSGEAATKAWCRRRLDAWSVTVPHRRRTVRCGDQTAHLVVTGEHHRHTLVVLFGRHGNAATATRLLDLLARHYRVVAVDLPGEAGLGSPGRPNTDRLRDYGAWFDQLLAVLAADSPGGMTVLGHGFGAAVALAATPGPHVSGLVLLSPACLARPAVDPATVASLAAWRVWPNRATSARLLSALAGPAFVPPPELVTWLRSVGRHVAMSSTPALDPTQARRWRSTPCTMAVGEHDPVFGAGRLARPAQRLLGTGLVTVGDAGFLLPYERPEAVLSLLRLHMRLHRRGGETAPSSPSPPLTAAVWAG